MFWDESNLVAKIFFWTGGGIWNARGGEGGLKMKGWGMNFIYLLKLILWWFHDFIKFIQINVILFLQNIFLSNPVFME